VREVGSFEASYVPKIADFSRLDERFRLPVAVWKKLPQASVKRRTPTQSANKNSKTVLAINMRYRFEW
jgi:hypothetical protein